MGKTAPNTLQNRPYANRPFVDMEAARELVPEVFEAKYNNSKLDDPNSDRPALRAMARHYSDDPSIMLKVGDVFGIGESAVASYLSSESHPDFMYKATQYRLLESEEVVELFRTMKLGVAAFKLLGSTAISGEQRPVLSDISREGVFSYQSLFYCNLRLPAQKVYIADFYPHIQKSDVMDYGMLGLQATIEKFDENMGFEFSTYAMHWIMQSIGRGLSNESRIVRLPVHRDQQMAKIGKKEEKIGRKMTAEEIAKTLDIEIEYAEAMRTFGDKSMTSLNKPVSEYNGVVTELGDIIGERGGSEETAIRDLLDRDHVRSILDKSELSSIETEVFCRLHGLAGFPQSDIGEIGKMLGYPKSKVMAIEAEAVEKIREKNTREEIALC